jgi:hypothetical protein
LSLFHCVFWSALDLYAVYLSIQTFMFITGNILWFHYFGFHGLLCRSQDSDNFKLDWGWIQIDLVCGGQL